MNLKGKKIAVTGASGMIGVYICRSLLEAGASVIGVVRNPDKADFLKNEGVEFRKADLGDKESLVQAFKGCDGVVSNAALYRLTNNNWQDYYKTNLQGTENVFSALARNKIKRIIHVSSIGVYRFSLFTIMDENFPQEKGEKKQGGSYKASKQLSEKLAWELAEKYNLDLTCIRPGPVYGARDSNTMPPFYFFMKFPFLPVPDIKMPFVYGGDVALSIRYALEKELSIAKSYNIAGDDYSIADFMIAWRKVAGKGAKIFPIRFPFDFGIRTNQNLAKRELGFSNISFEDGLKEVFLEEPEMLL